MKPSKPGMPTGKQDIGYKPICIGDLVKDRNSGILYRVDKFGYLINTVLPDVTLKEWDGNDYVVCKAEAKISPVNEAKLPQTTKETSDVAERVSDEKRPQSEPEDVILDTDLTKPEWPKLAKSKGHRSEGKSLKGGRFVWIDGKRKFFRPGEVMPETATKAPEAKAPEVKGREQSDAELVKILRDRGYTVTATKLIEL